MEARLTVQSAVEGHHDVRPDVALPLDIVVIESAGLEVADELFLVPGAVGASEILVPAPGRHARQLRPDEGHVEGLETRQSVEDENVPFGQIVA